jgi:hypothetical protein
MGLIICKTKNKDIDLHLGAVYKSFKFFCKELVKDKTQSFLIRQKLLSGFKDIFGEELFSGKRTSPDDLIFFEIISHCERGLPFYSFKNFFYATSIHLADEILKGVNGWSAKKEIIKKLYPSDKPEIILIKELEKELYCDDPNYIARGLIYYLACHKWEGCIEGFLSGKKGFAA